MLSIEKYKYAFIFFRLIYLKLNFLRFEFIFFFLTEEQRKNKENIEFYV